MRVISTCRFGKIDFAKFGSARFARFIDKLPQFTRTGTLVKPAEAAPEVTLDAGSYRREVMTYAGDNMPDGGNIGQLNNRLMSAFGKDYFRALGFGDFKSALSSVGEVRVGPETKVFLAEAVKPELAVKPAGMPGPDEKAVFARIQKYAAGEHAGRRKPGSAQQRAYGGCTERATLTIWAMGISGRCYLPFRI